VADAKPPEGQSEGQAQVGTEGPPQNREGVQKDARHFWLRVAGAGVLLLLAIGLVLWLFVDPPDSFAAKVSIVVAAAFICGVGAVCLPLGLRNRLGTFGIVAATSAGILAAVLAIPDRSSVSPASDESTGPASQSSSNSPSSDESDPFTWDLAFFGRCEGFDVDNSLLKSLPVRDKLNAEWAYKNGGATDNSVITLTIQGNSDAAVVLKGIHIVDLERSPAPSDISAVYPCEVSGGHLDRRYYELVLDEHPRLTARPGRDVDDTITEPVKDFPFKVSDSDPEYFEFDIAPGPACLCSWKIALDWTSRGRSGTTIIDRGFSGIRTVVTRAEIPYYNLQKDGSWEPPLPE
jgi:hypothetical protein